MRRKGMNTYKIPIRNRRVKGGAFTYGRELISVKARTRVNALRKVTPIAKRKNKVIVR